MKFIALVANRIHASVAAAPTQPSSTAPTIGKLTADTYNPLPTASSAANTCARSLTQNGHTLVSSR